MKFFDGGGEIRKTIRKTDTMGRSYGEVKRDMGPVRYE